MKKIIINEAWEEVEIDDDSNFYAIVYEHSAPVKKYVWAFDTDYDSMKKEFNAFKKQLADSEDKLITLSLIKLPNTNQIRELLEAAYYDGNEDKIATTNQLLNRMDTEVLKVWTAINEAKKRKKKQGSLSPFSSLTYTTGDPDLNIKFFNKRMGTDFEDQAKDAAKAAEKAADAANSEITAAASENSTISSGNSTISGAEATTSGESASGEAAGGEGASMGESLKEAYKDYYRVVYADYTDDDENDIEEDKVLLKPGQTKGDLAVYLSYRLGYTHIYIYDEREANDEEIAQADILGFDTIPGNFNPKYFGNADDDFDESLKKLDEAKRYVKRYYVRPQNIFCSNKEDILQALLRVGDENCSIYSLKSLADHEDVHLLKPSDIIYYYDDGILYDKNHVKVMDYDLFVKHEEERKKFPGEKTNVSATTEIANEYDDRLTTNSLRDKEAVANFKAINEEVVEEAVEMKSFSKDPQQAIELERAFNKSYLPNLSHLVGKKLRINYRSYSAPQSKTWTSTVVGEIEKLYVGSHSGKLCIKVPNLARYITNREYIYAETYFDKSLYINGYRTHILHDDPEVEAALDAWLSARNEAIKVIARNERGDERRRIRTDETADAVLKSPRCEELKKWLIKHVSDIHFIIPTCSAPEAVTLDDTLDEEEFERLCEKWEDAETKFLSKWNPELVENVDYSYKDAVDSPEKVASWYKFRGISGIITFDVDLNSEEIPDEISLLIQLAKKESEDAGVGRKVDFDVKGKVLSSFYAGLALGKIFGTNGYYNINFYKHKTEENPFETDFPNVNVFGESLKEGKDDKFICCICGEECEGYGNNPEPVRHEGRCCDACNSHFVIPARLVELESAEEEAK